MEKSVRNKGFLQRVRIISCIVILFLLSVQTPGLPAESFEEGAKREGKLMYYTMIPTANSQMLASAFQKKYPYVKVEFYRAGTDALLGRVLKEKKMGQTFADVLSINGSFINLFKRDGLLGKHISPESNFIPPGLKDPEGLWTADYTDCYVFMYNTKMVAKTDLPKTYEDLLLPKWKGKIGLSSNELEWFMGMLDFMGEEKGRQFMNRFGENAPTIRSGRTLAVNLMVAGEYPLAMGSLRALRELQRAGAPIDMIPFPVPTLGSIRMIVMHASAPHPNAAKLFVDFLLSKDGQGIFDRLSYQPVRTDVKMTDPVVEEIRRNMFLIKPRAPELVDGYNREYYKVFKIR